MRIQTKIFLFTTVLLFVVVAGISFNLVWFQQRHIRLESAARIDAIVGGVSRIAGEAVRAGDEIMLLSYLKNLLKEYPEIELAVVESRERTVVIGELRTSLYFRTIAPADTKALSAAPGLYTVKLGFSREALEKRIARQQFLLLSEVLAIAGIGLLLGLLGSWWFGRKLTKPIVSLAAQMQTFAKGKLKEKTDIKGDEIAHLKEHYRLMAANILENIQFKEDLIMTLSHELNNPLAGLKGLLWNINNSGERLPREEIFKDCKVMSDAVGVMELSLSNTLQLFRLGSRPALKPERIEVSKIMEATLQLLRPVAQSKNIALHEEIAPSPACINGDEELVRRIIINLISNACKYTPAGGSVKVVMEDLRDKVAISVSDTGPGIEPKDRELIFTKFYRVPGPDGRQERIPGTGLGLAIARQAVELHGGRIWVESEKGRGSKFCVILPKQGTGG